MKITLCGTISFLDNMKKVKQELEGKGFQVKMPEFNEEDIVKERYMQTEPKGKNNNNANIEWADSILVLNYDKNGITNYISPNILVEMGIANYLNKKIFILNDIASLSYKEEIEVMNPTIINDDLNIFINEFIKSKIRTIPNFPKEGIMFRDITTLMKDKEGFKHLINILVKRYEDEKIDVVAGIESRGFITGAILANKLGIGFVPIRKPGKLPAETVCEEYSLEYGTDKIEIHTDAIKQGDNVLIVDDLVATGGTSIAACNLVKKLGGNIIEFSYIIDLPDLKGKEKLKKAGIKTFNLVEFKGD